MEKIEYIELPYIEVTQPIGSFIICSMAWQNIIDISYADIRKITESSENNDLDNYLGIQRTVSKNRTKDISQYVTNIDATFPTSIILHIKSKSLFFNGELIEIYDDQFIEDNSENIKEIKNIFTSEYGKIKIRKDDRIAKILDGQHRIEGFREAINKGEIITKFDFNVTIFVDLDLDDQAQIFSVINKAQTKVNKSLVYDLYEYAKNRSPQKTAHDIVRVLNKSKQSAFYRKIKILGTSQDAETIAQATLAELIIDCISKNPMEDRDKLKKQSLFGRSGLNKESDINEIKRRIFRNLFIAEKDEIIYKIINNYFNAIAEKWPRAWKNDPIIEKNIISKSTGIIAFFRFLRYLYNEIGQRDSEISKETFLKIFNQIPIDDVEFNTDKYKPGSSGQSLLFKDLVGFHEKNRKPILL